MNNNLLELRKEFLQKKISKQQFIEQAANSQNILFSVADAIDGSFIREVAVTKSGISYSLIEPNVSFLQPHFDSRIPPVEALNFGDYEPELRKALITILAKINDQSGVVFDIGANIGWYSVILASLFPKQQFYSFEPITPVFSIAKKNIELNNLKNINLVNCGFGEKEQRMKFRYLSNCSVASVIETEKSQEHGEQVDAAITTVDLFCERNNVAPKLIKCDIEGAELLMLKGAKNIIESKRPIIIMEMLRKWSARFNYHPNDIINLLRGLNYQCFAITEEGVIKFSQMTEETVETNFIFSQEALI